MDIRTKLVFTLVAVALGSMLSLAYLMYLNVESGLEERRLDQLNGLAEFKVESLENIVEGWYERMSLVASRTGIRATLAEAAVTTDGAAGDRLGALLDEVRTASPSFAQLWLHDVSGGLVASSGPYPSHAFGLDALERADDVDGAGPWFLGTVFPEEDGVAFAEVAAPLELDGERIGYLRAFLSTAEVAELSREYEGLETTGETMVVTRTNGGIRAVHGARAAPVPDSTLDLEGFRQPGFSVDPGGLAARSLEEEEFAGRGVDYRGREVLAAVDFLPETGWGVVVKIDAEEQAVPALDFRTQVVRSAVVLASFAILIGLLLGFRVAQPIHVLAEAANRIRGGDLSARTEIRREDEVGLLAQTFDQMAAELEEQVTLLTEYRRFFDLSLDMLCIAATDGFYKKVNQTFTRELGWSEEEMLSRPIVSFVHPDDVDKTARELEKLNEGIPTIRFENRILCKDGRYKRLRWRSAPEEGTDRLYAIARVIGEVPADEGHDGTADERRI